MSKQREQNSEQITEALYLAVVWAPIVLNDDHFFIASTAAAAAVAAAPESRSRFGSGSAPARGRRCCRRGSAGRVLRRLPRPVRARFVGVDVLRRHRGFDDLIHGHVAVAGPAYLALALRARGV
jgi:hypothetical protein